MSEGKRTDEIQGEILHVYDDIEEADNNLPTWWLLTFYGAIAAGIYEWSEDNSAEIDKGWILQADTVEELARKIAAHPYNKSRMDAAVLTETVAQFAEYAERGEDPEYGRDPESLGALATPPYYAIDMYPGGPNTEGGMIRNAKSQVISVYGEPIRRLYAVGEVGSFYSFAYQGGGNIAGCIIFGRIAGESAATEESWT